MPSDYGRAAEDVDIKDLLFVLGEQTDTSHGYLFVSDLNFGIFCFALELGSEGDDKGNLLEYRYSVPLNGHVSSFNWDREHRVIIVATLIPVQVYIFELHIGGVVHQSGTFRAES